MGWGWGIWSVDVDTSIWACCVDFGKNLARQVMLENYINCLTIEAQTMINMVETGFVPACAKDLKKCENMSSKFSEPRKTAYEAIVDELLASKTTARTSSTHTQTFLLG